MIGTYTAAITANNSLNAVTATTVVTIHCTCCVRLYDDPTDYPTVQAAVDTSTCPTDMVKVA
jgi:hypothetical protein